MTQDRASTGGSSVERVRRALSDAGISAQVKLLPQSSRTAAEAARAIGCELGQIAKSLVFRRADDGNVVLVVASGSNRVDPTMVARHIGVELAMADPELVRASTGFAIGGVAPVGHPTRLAIWIDEDLLEFEVVWAAAGTPNAVVCLTPRELVAVTGGQVIGVCRKRAE